jgi:hypothetical protein
MPDDRSGDVPLDDLLDSYRVTAPQNSYRMKASDLSSHFDLIDDFLSSSPEPVHVELAELGFQNYHRKGYLSEEDQVVVYADLEVEERREPLDDRTEVVLGKRHRSETETAAIPIEFTDMRDRPYQNLDLFMPTHEAYEQEMKALR